MSLLKRVWSTLLWNLNVSNKFRWTELKLLKPVVHSHKMYTFRNPSIKLRKMLHVTETLSKRPEILFADTTFARRFRGFQITHIFDFHLNLSSGKNKPNSDCHLNLPHYCKTEILFARKQICSFHFVQPCSICILSELISPLKKLSLNTVKNV